MKAGRIVVRPFSERAKVQKRVLALFERKTWLSVADITIALGVCDPRGHIRELRKKGYQIVDKWQEGDDNVRYKVYMLKPYKLNNDVRHDTPTNK